MDILHSDCNNFYASVECHANPKIADKPVVVCGSIKDRHGIVLSKNYPAKALGIFTGQVLNKAYSLCPDLIAIEADFNKYLDYSKRVKDIYRQYSDRVESFSIDESWIDVTCSKIFGTPLEIAEKIKERVKAEVGITVSIGVSFSKIFAKLGSDYKKPDAITHITKENYKDILWPLPIRDLLYVGRSTEKKLLKMNILTIGDMAKYDPQILKQKLGKWGEVLYGYCYGRDNSYVKFVGEKSGIKSVGNSYTCYRDLLNIDDVKSLLTVLCESVTNRMFSHHLYKARTLCITIRDSNLFSYTRQIKFKEPTAVYNDIFDTALELFNSQRVDYPLRSLGVSVTDFVYEMEQLSLFQNEKKYEKHFKLDRTVKELKDKYSFSILSRGTVAGDDILKKADPQTQHTIHPKQF